MQTTSRRLPRFPGDDVQVLAVVKLMGLRDVCRALHVTALSWMGSSHHELKDLGFLLTSVVELSGLVLVTSPLWASVSTSIK